ncbi:hypothetical protein BU17DRAFT_66576 [Hysterangium stoloniferum]|nr:hypothetical protein BU17DRAFT_66576 [Hysterangium stoloniferum]
MKYLSSVSKVSSLFPTVCICPVQVFFRRPSDLLIAICSQSIFKAFRTFPGDPLIFWLLFVLKASSKHPGQFQSSHLTTSLQYPGHFQVFLLIAGKLGTSDKLF